MGYPAHLKAEVRDLWEKKDMGSFSEKYTDEVPSHGVVMIKVEP
jgi:alpha-galactosidase